MPHAPVTAKKGIKKYIFQIRIKFDRNVFIDIIQMNEIKTSTFYTMRI
jgi:hypothetical protein